MALLICLPAAVASAAMPATGCGLCQNPNSLQSIPVRILAFTEFHHNLALCQRTLSTAAECRVQSAEFGVWVHGKTFVLPVRLVVRAYITRAYHTGTLTKVSTTTAPSPEPSYPYNISILHRNTKYYTYMFMFCAYTCYSQLKLS